MSASFDISHSFCCCKILIPNSPPHAVRGKSFNGLVVLKFRSLPVVCRVGFISNRELNGNLNERIPPHALRNNLVLSRVSQDEDEEEEQEEEESMLSQFKSYEQDPMVGKLRSQLGVLHPIPSPPINRNVVGLFVFFFFVGVFFDKIWTSARNKITKFYGFGAGNQSPQIPTSLSSLLEKDLQRKESVEWVNMVLGKLWKVYRSGIENWIVGLLQPVIDNLEKPDYVERVFIKQFSLGDEPLSVRSVERRTSRRVNDLQYQIGLRYTGGARALLMLTLKFNIIPITVPVGIRDFDIDGELWVKLRLIESEPWVGAVQWAFVTLPKIKFELSPFRLFNLMRIPVLSMFLTKLLTEDLPRLFVKPNKIVLDFETGTAVAKSGDLAEGNRDFVGELSVTLVDARDLFYVFYGKTDPYVILKLGDQVIRSKKNSQTTVIGPPGQPIWNQDFHMLVANHRKQKLMIQVEDSLGFADFTVGTGEVDLGSLQDTVPTDRVVVLRGGIKTFGKGTAGELLLRLTYKAYVDDEDDVPDAVDLYTSDDESFNLYKIPSDSSKSNDKESFIGLLAALIVSEEFQGIVASDAGNNKVSDDLANTLANEKATSNSNGLQGVVWFAVLTAMFIVVAITMDNANYFNH